MFEGLLAEVAFGAEEGRTNPHDRNHVSEEEPDCPRVAKRQRVRLIHSQKGAVRSLPSNGSLQLYDAAHDGLLVV